MSKIKLKTYKKKLFADTITPVSVYLKLRDHFANSFLLESSDYHGSENRFSYICCSPIGHFKAEGNQVIIKFPGKEEVRKQIDDLSKQLHEFISSFDATSASSEFVTTGLFGYLSYDCVSHFDQLEIETSDEIPLAQYLLFEFLIVMDHFKNECHLIQTYLGNRDEELFEEVLSLIQQRNIPDYPFKVVGKRSSSCSDEAYLEMVNAGIQHCHKGDVFQVVMSRKFEIPFQGDDFKVYRALRSVNPSPYLFYFDFGRFKLFGSSPEAQIILKDGKAEIHPIAGTFKRTGNDGADAELARGLLNDEKENSEHVMLVDLARNDLSRSCENVAVDTYKEVQYYSHVIHLASRVSGDIMEDTPFIDIVAQTFPAGTLSGAPKIRAMEIISETEQSPRGYYGGAVGFMGFDGNFNHAIMIRSFLCKGNQLQYRAGAGIVAQSDPESELQEVYNKVGALEQSVNLAKEI